MKAGELVRALMKYKPVQDNPETEALVEVAYLTEGLGSPINLAGGRYVAGRYTQDNTIYFYVAPSEDDNPVFLAMSEKGDYVVGTFKDGDWLTDLHETYRLIRMYRCST